MATFKLHGKENELKDQFIKKHKNCREAYRAPKPYTYLFTPNGIGIGVTIRCPYCGKVQDITDVSTW